MRLPIRLISHNIRYATDSPLKGEERWEVRCHRLCAQLEFHAHNPPTTFICLQEVLHTQLIDIMNSLNHSSDFGASWDYIGVGRDDGKKAGEYNPILYRSDIWHLEKSMTFWLSETPLVPSRGWDAACNRLVTIGGFKHRRTGQNVAIMCTHLDHQGTQARRMSARGLLVTINDFAKEFSPSLLLLAGDFNSPPDDDAYKLMTIDSGMVDVCTLIPKDKRYGNEMTYTSFGYVDNTPSRIDFIFARQNESPHISSYAVLANCFDDGVFLSDHRACVADFWLS
ncbi:endonuclease/exonuclease/phosphatase family protein-like protein [Xylogone sp. PMI_703]|nr:endonuclease/exonuclease/phosphatase family protein-like protein [Xylogone sp. PMI_703]